MTSLPGFTVQIDQNPYLPVGGRDVSAVVTVTADADADADAARKDRRLIFARALRGMVSECLRRDRRLPERRRLRKRYA